VSDFAVHDNNKGLSIKEYAVRGVVSNADIFRIRGVPQMRTSALFAEKISDFSNFMVCPHELWGRGFEPMRTFYGQGWSIFCDFVRTSFMDVP